MEALIHFKLDFTEEDLFDKLSTLEYKEVDDHIFSITLNDIPDYLIPLIDLIEKEYKFKPNCVEVSKYTSHKADTKWLTEGTSNLEDNTGIVLVSFGDKIGISFKVKETDKFDKTYMMFPKSVLWMSKESQELYEHSYTLNKNSFERGSIILSFKHIKPNGQT